MKETQPPPDRDRGQKEKRIMYKKLEQKFGKYAIRGLMKYVVVLYIVGLILSMSSAYTGANESLFERYLAFNVDKIMEGQFWRVISWVVQPPDAASFWVIISVIFYYYIGSTLERVWGSFRFNLFYFSGIFFNLIAGILFYFISEMIVGEPINYPLNLTYINLSMFMAFAVIFSDVSVLLYFIIPIKVKYLAYLYMGIELFNIAYYFRINAAFGAMMLGLFVISMGNFFIFYFNYKKYGPGGFKQRKRAKQFSQAYNRGQAASAAAASMYSRQQAAPKPITIHKCAVCGRTELDGDDLEFRFCSKCNGNYEYCMDHLHTHEHVQ